VERAAALLAAAWFPHGPAIGLTYTGGNKMRDRFAVRVMIACNIALALILIWIVAENYL
jgi:hypothetical protein